MPRPKKQLVDQDGFFNLTPTESLLVKIVTGSGEEIVPYDEVLKQASMSYESMKVHLSRIGQKDDTLMRGKYGRGIEKDLTGVAFKEEGDLLRFKRFDIEPLNINLE